jgi:hypothetical protein
MIVQDLFVAPESTFATDPDADGSDYLFVPQMDAQFPSDTQRLEDPNYSYNVDVPSSLVPVQAGAELQLTVPAVGYAAASGDGAAAPTQDWLDKLLANAFGSVTSLGGEGVGTGSTTSNAILDTPLASLVAGHLLPVNFADAGHAAAYLNRMHWRFVNSVGGAPTYGVAPVWPEAPANGDVVYGSAQHIFNGAGSSLSAFARIGAPGSTVGHLLVGGRWTSLKLSQNAGEMARFSGSLRFNGLTVGGSKASLPTIARMAVPPALGVRASVVFNGTTLACSSAEVDFGLVTEDVKSTEAANGRQAISAMRAWPKITISPLQDTATWHAALQAGTEGSLIVQFGAGTLGSGRVNTLAFGAQFAQVEKLGYQRDGQTLRHQVTLRVTNSIGTSSYFWVLARA